MLSTLFVYIFDIVLCHFDGTLLGEDDNPVYSSCGGFYLIEMSLPKSFEGMIRLFRKSGSVSMKITHFPSIMKIMHFPFERVV